MARQKKEKKKAEHIEPEAVAFHTNVVEHVKPAEVVPVEIAQCDTWRYHKTEEPRIFKQGKEIPEGWTRGNRKLWQISDVGKWSRVNG